VKEVLLKENVENLGYRGDVVKVADGYARNYLLPRNLALPVTPSNQRQVERERAKAAAFAAEERQGAEALATRIGALTCVVARKVGATDTLFGSVTSADLAEFLVSQQIEIDKRKIQLGEPLKQLGESTVPIKLHRDVVAHLKVSVVKEGADDEPVPDADTSAPES